MKAPKKHKKGCGCSGSSSDEKTPALEQPAYEKDATEAPLLGKKYARAVETPSVTPRTRIFKQPEALSEIVLQSPGTIPVRAVVPTREAVPELVEELKKSVREISAPPVKEGRGAIDIKLENRDGAHVKSGTVTLDGPQGKVSVPLDPTSRRFRMNDLAPGEYTVEAASASAGRGFLRVKVRSDDVTRSALSLDGSTLKGTTSVRFALRGSESSKMNIRAKDSATGKRVFEGVVEAQNGVFQLDRVPFGKIHFDMDDENAKSCYDAEVNDNIFELPPLEVEFNPTIPIGPDPPEWRFDGLGWELAGVAAVLPALDINSIEDLANAEPEALMHRALEKGTEDITPVHARLFAKAIDQARYSLGMRKAVGEQSSQLRLGDGRTFTRSFLPRNAGDSEIEINLGPGKSGELSVDGPSGTDKRSFTGSTIVKFTVSEKEIAAGKTVDLSLKNTSGAAITGNLVAKLATDAVSPGFFFSPPSAQEMIENLLEALAVQNPGLGTSLPEAVMAPENIEMWMDRARTFMSAAGVCSMNDLGRCRFNSSTVLTPGAYVAPVVQPPSGVVTALGNYVFSHVLANSILYYVPNDILHDTAVILAGEWDLRGQTIILAREVRELVVVVGSIRHNGASRITWETPSLPTANSYWPNPANRGANGIGPGAGGQDGEDGDQNPHPSKNGGANPPVPGPTITMYIRDSTSNIPPIDLRGQNGGRGGRGQDGGRGGDGDCGLRADGTVFGGCCRGVGHGGNGGQGGDGGRGGKGGSGGGGGRITILTTAPGLAVLQSSPPSIDVNGGNGGSGGDPGNPGNGGTGGPAGTADCEPWCDEHPERRGSDGARGADGSNGFTGDAGPGVVEDAIQILPITDEQWQEEFNRPHILDVDPDEVEPGQTVQIRGQNFIPGTHRVYFDGFNVGPVTSTTQASFVVPTTSEGGYHPVVIRNPSDAAQRSNRVMLLVVPVLDAIPAGTRFVENQNITLTGLAFKTGLQLLAEDRSVSPAASFALPVIGVTRTAINAQIPGGFLGSLRGVRRLVVRNPEGGTSRAQRVARISDTIVVRCAAFRVTGTTPGIGTTRSAADITNLFIEGAVNSLSIPWAPARIVFRLVQPVATINVADDIANLWPIIDTPTDTTTFNNAPGVLGALNFFFVRDVNIATAYAYFGGGPIFVGDEGSPLGLVDFQQVVAHEIGHALCLRHQCDGSGGEPPGTFFDRDCEDGDEAFLMYPFWDTSDGMALSAGQIDPARIGATNVEDGKINPLPVGSIFRTALPPTLAQCLAADLTD